MIRKSVFLLTGGVFLSGIGYSNLSLADSEDNIEKVVVWGSDSTSNQFTTNPSSRVTPEDLESVNIVTTEDIVKYEPSLTIRRRYIGDANGTLGIRGSNMFQTSRSMVFADGVPLHYLLQSRWNGAPRWTMVSASEIADVQVLYGPFSAQYSGNAMGGVVLIETAIPQEFEFHFDTSVFQQDFNAYGFDDKVNGNKSFVSVGNKFGDLSLYASYNRLDNDSQPQSFYYGSNANSSGATGVTGGIVEQDQYGRTQLFFGDTGIVNERTDNYKLKVGYDFENWSTLMNIAFEDRNSKANNPNSYLTDSNGSQIYSGVVTQGDRTIKVPASRLAVKEQVRQSLSIGLRVRGDLSDNLALEGNINQFDILKDETGTSAQNPQDPSFTVAGQIADYDDTGWTTAEVKLTVRELGSDALQLVTGARLESYELNYSLYSAPDYLELSNTTLTSQNGGKTKLAGIFSELGWQATPDWDATLGLRYESFDSSGGYFSSNNTSGLTQNQVPSSSESRFSPKLSIGYQPAEDWDIRYAFAQAYRFPIVEELFAQYQAYNAISVANPNLAPEAGRHHNLSIQKRQDDGLLQLNIFIDDIDNVIESQSLTLAGGQSLRTFIPVDNVLTRGIEWIAQQKDFLIPNLNLRFNATYTRSVIEENNAEPDYEGKDYPRIPKWRTNLNLDYSLSEQWLVGANIQYASDSYGQLDNSDTATGVYGAIDSYTRIGLTTKYQWNDNLSFRAGVDNLSNDIKYVAHPWPGRTFYFSVAYDL
ncbi:TonB-dependent receptor [Paraneptunicella aestuarii]|uniref:TonB-dependent receptor n=1 Tax=Paraneptunicella aestuarii TaxID=2831148 RepID=UPI001E300D3D|nr:TonB-dependent receptor [Paraneptunicella aestuarii]UAA38332.1 TonB-dependent receptor [Paraneptunicella aestuarii]